MRKDHLPSTHSPQTATSPPKTITKECTHDIQLFYCKKCKTTFCYDCLEYHGVPNHPITQSYKKEFDEILLKMEATHHMIGVLFYSQKPILNYLYKFKGKGEDLEKLKDDLFFETFKTKFQYFCESLYDLKESLMKEDAIINRDRILNSTTINTQQSNNQQNQINPLVNHKNPLQMNQLSQPNQVHQTIQPQPQQISQEKNDYITTNTTPNNESHYKDGVINLDESLNIKQKRKKNPPRKKKINKSTELIDLVTFGERNEIPEIPSTIEDNPPQQIHVETNDNPKKRKNDIDPLNEPKKQKIEEEIVYEKKEEEKKEEEKKEEEKKEEEKKEEEKKEEEKEVANTLLILENQILK